MYLEERVDALEKALEQLIAQQNETQLQRAVTQKEAALMLGVTAATVSRYADSELIDRLPNGRITIASIEAFKKDGKSTYAKRNAKKTSFHVAR